MRDESKFPWRAVAVWWLIALGFDAATIAIYGHAVTVLECGAVGSIVGLIAARLYLWRLRVTRARAQWWRVFASAWSEIGFIALLDSQCIYRIPRRVIEGGEVIPANKPV